MKLTTLMLMFAAFLSGCSASLEDYRQTQPNFELKSYFDGRVTARGMIEDYSGKLVRHFCVDIIGSWDGNRGELDETFYFNDGEIQKRIWKLNIADNGVVTGTAGDVVGTASGRSQGQAFNWHYTLEVPMDDTRYEFAIDDWMYQLDKQRIMNRSYMKKFGVTVAEISIYFDKTLAPCQSG
ncbi:hypothetical protein HMF8227_02209 [Saliniradius amylolyticus]|uniref:Lipoprotein n=1 Tax=Saliniradius amylolyticus TaxID=2183582 RepID=A0A2S2E559_9ALTE|nr:DUF3833 domain-containing protein [Saliniradius amylolyticus]AWL12662.1 hypothetical protein HMF8227_02209 [Saliniradius amylolyticus]